MMSGESKQIRLGKPACLLVLLALGCRTLVHYEPEPPDVDGRFQLHGILDYSGDPQFLPLAVTAAQPGTTALGLRYRYRTTYEHSSSLQTLNPLILIGYRGIGVDVESSGRLEITVPARTSEIYEASCLVRMRRSVWIWGPTESELRRLSLVAVRKMIDSEILRDRMKLEALLDATAPEPEDDGAR